MVVQEVAYKPAVGLVIAWLIINILSVQHLTVNFNLQ